MIASAVMLLGVFVFPLWVITLAAPQYPTGLGMRIWIDRIEGATEHDLQIINGVNHYIGMKKIAPEAIPELRYMKYFAMGLAATAALVGVARRRWLLLTWVLIAIALAGLGMYDFWKWEYNYGHDLDPSAAIKVPGMSYQPPMFGTKHMLNFRTTAWPGPGGILAMIGVALPVLCLFYELRLRGRGRFAGIAGATVKHPVQTGTPALLAALAILVAAGCAKKPQAIVYGTDACEFCAMTITNDRYGAVIVTEKGRTLKFDAVECMLQSRMPGEKFADTGVHAWYVVDYVARGTLVKATGAAFLVSPALPSPMGAGITAFGNRTDAERIAAEKGGEVMDWEAVGAYLAQWIKS
jgi:copper chaperone NosL